MEKLISGLQEFQTGYFASHREMFQGLADGQNPRVLFITCSDSRIDPNLILQAKVGELFVIRNAGNIIPPYGATNGGEGAALEYALAKLGIEQVIVCGHSNCGAMKGLLQLEKLKDSVPLVYEWLKWAEATRRVIQENYSQYEGLELLELTIAENVLSQLENLHTYPIIRSKIHQGKLALHGWIYRIDKGEVLAYDPEKHDFVYPHSRINLPEHEYILHPSCPVNTMAPFTIDSRSYAKNKSPQKKQTLKQDYSPYSQLPGYSRLPLEQAQRIYRGSY